MRYKEDLADINGVDIYYREYDQGNGGGDPLLLIMGLSANADWWGESFVRELSSRFKVVAFDNRGAGRSGKPEGPYSIPQMAADAVGLMDHLGWQSAHVLGASMGGMIAQELALDWPERVRRLVLLCTNCGGREQVLASPEIYALLNIPRKGLSQEDIAWASLPLLFPQSYIDENPAAMRDIVKAFLVAPIEPRCFVWQMAAVTSWSDYRRLKDMRPPTLIMTGSEDVLIPPENSRILADAIPDSRLVVIPGAGHALQVMFPREVAGEVLKFIT
ncbi:MAG: alpha/beta fold hydrolase [Actinobacteria bacterium]|nr:alpha/beta fold hydrolase [Actinomycetota bacterium]